MIFSFFFFKKAKIIRNSFTYTSARARLLSCRFAWALLSNGDTAKRFEYRAIVYANAQQLRVTEETKKFHATPFVQK
jgi:hypothetical protein